MGLTGAALAFYRVTTLLACLIQNSQDQQQPLVLQELGGRQHPPSVGQLTRLFAELTGYSSLTLAAEHLSSVVPAGYATTQEILDALKAVSSTSGLANPPDALTSLSGLYEATRPRGKTWTHLQNVIGRKRVENEIHGLLADAARAHLAKTRAADYLIVTTNYDTLMEQALEARQIPYVVLLTRRSDQRVVARFSPGLDDDGQLAEQHAGCFPNNFAFNKSQSLVVLHKLHGCASPELRESDDGIVISDSDYVGFISQMSSSQGVIPTAVGTLMRDRPFLFLGYSLSDWNVRSVFDSVRAKRNNKRVMDYSVMLTVREYDEVFFEKNQVTICKTDLSLFAQRVRAKRP